MENFQKSQKANFLAHPLEVGLAQIHRICKLKKQITWRKHILKRDLIKTGFEANGLTSQLGETSPLPLQSFNLWLNTNLNKGVSLKLQAYLIESIAYL